MQPNKKKAKRPATRKKVKERKIRTEKDIFDNHEKSREVDPNPLSA